MIRIISAAIVSLLLSLTAAQAQSGCSIFTFKNVPTAGQWNDCLKTKQDSLGYQAVNQAGDSMTGRLSTIASTTFRSGFAIAPGVAPTTPVNGDIWLTSTGVFVRINGVTVGPLSATGSSVPSVIQGDLLYGTGTGTLGTLNKNTSATRYLANTGTTNNPQWDFVNLANGVTGLLALANIANGTSDTVLGYWGSTVVTATAIANCGGALTYSTSTHSFGCNASGGVFASGTPTANQFALWTNSTTIQGISAASKSDQQTGTSTTAPVTPSQAQSHDSAIKAWVNFVGSSGALNGSYNVTGVSRTGTGSYTITFTTAFANTNYACAGSVEDNGGNEFIKFGSTVASHKTITTQDLFALNTSNALADPTNVNIHCTGRQ